jgi:hypothetical protein
LPAAESHLVVHTANRIEKMTEYVRLKVLSPLLSSSQTFRMRKRRLPIPYRGPKLWREMVPEHRTIDFVRFMAGEAADIGARLSVVMLPGSRTGYNVDVDRIKRGLDGISTVDLDAKAVALGLYPSQILPDGHYNKKLTAFIGTEIGNELCQSQSGGHRRSGRGRRRAKGDPPA